MKFSKNVTDLKGAFNVSEIQITYRTKLKAEDRPMISNSRFAYQAFMQSWDRNTIEVQEQFKLLFLDQGNRAIGISILGLGGISGCIGDLRLAFATAIKVRASGMILAHNHPSGNLKASKNDVLLTSNFTKAGSYLGIPVLDHLIVSKDGYRSLADEGDVAFTPQP